MFVIFISFIFILNMSDSRTTANKNVLIKEKLRRSVTHLKDVLFAIEDKIKQEKTKLSQIIYKLNHKLNPPVARMETTVKPSSKPKDYYNINTTQTTLETPAPMFTFPTMFPSPPEDNIWSPTEMANKLVITDISVLPGSTKVTTTESQFIKDIRKTMREDNHNYYTAFLTRFTELIAIKTPIDTMPVIKLLLVKLKEKVNTIIFDEGVGKNLTEALKRYIPVVSEMAPEKLQGRHTASEVCDMILEAVINPYIRNRGTVTNTTVSATNGTTESIVPVTVSPVYNIKQYRVHVTQYPVTKYREQVHVPTTKYEPSWRRNFEKNVKHFILKRPKLLERIKQHYRNIKKNKDNHLLSRKQKLDQNYRKSGTGQLNEHKQFRKRAHISSEEVHNRPKYFHDNVQNHILYKIRETSSYSDEERHLRNNLYDALRHGNTTFESFRKLGGDIIDKQTLRDVSSEPDEEWVLKNNIYKVFEQ